MPSIYVGSRFGHDSVALRIVALPEGVPRVSGNFKFLPARPTARSAIRWREAAVGETTSSFSGTTWGPRSARDSLNADEDCSNLTRRAAHRAGRP